MAQNWRSVVTERWGWNKNSLNGWSCSGVFEDSWKWIKNCGSLQAEAQKYSIAFLSRRRSIVRFDTRWDSGQCYPIVPWIIMKRSVLLPGFAPIEIVYHLIDSLPFQGDHNEDWMDEKIDQRTSTASKYAICKQPMAAVTSTFIHSALYWWMWQWRVHHSSAHQWNLICRPQKKLWTKIGKSNDQVAQLQVSSCPERMTEMRSVQCDGHRLLPVTGAISVLKNLPVGPTAAPEAKRWSSIGIENQSVVDRLNYAFT